VFRKVTILFASSGADTDGSRWDTPQHVLVDDVDGTDRPEIWPGMLCFRPLPAH
jgi:hypothetical protein